MAERQIVFRWIRQNIAAILAALTLSALTVTSLDAGTVTADAIAAGDPSLGVTGTEIAIAATTGGAVTANASGVTVAAASAGDDITIDAIDVLSLEGGSLSLASDLTTLGLSSAGAMSMTSADTLTASGTVSVLSGSTSAGLSVATGGVVNAETGGVSITASGAGDDVSIDAADDAYIEGGSARLTLDDSGGAVFTVPVTSPIVAAATAFPTALALGTDIVDATPSLANSTEILSTMTLPAGAFSSDGKTLVVEIVGWAAGNTNTKAVDVLIGPVGSGTGGTGVIGCNFNNAADMQWKITGEIWRRSEDAQGVYYLCEGGNGLTNGTRSRGSSEQASSSTVDDGEAIEMNVTVVNLTDAADLGINLVRWSWR